MPENWRLIQDPLLDGHENMAVDEAVLTVSDAAEDFTPTLRLYGWSAPTISIGYLQDSTGLFDLGLPAVRRITGGRAVLHDAEVTYSITAPVTHPLFSGGITSAYSEISRCISSALRDAGVEAQTMRAKSDACAGRARACFSAPSRHEVVVNGKKIVGSAQRRFKNAFLQHGSILFSIDEEKNGRIFGRGLLDAMTCVSAHSAITMDEFRGLLVRNFMEGLGASFQNSITTISETEAYVKKGLMECKYSNPGWNSVAVQSLRNAGGYGR